MYSPSTGKSLKNTGTLIVHEPIHHADLKDAHIQDIARVLAGRYTENQMEDVLRYFEALDIAREAANSDELPNVSTKRGTRQNWFRVANGTPVGRKILAYMIENRQHRVDEIEDLQDALAGSRFVLQEGDDGLELMLRITATAEAEVKDQRATSKSKLRRRCLITSMKQRVS